MRAGSVPGCGSSRHRGGLCRATLSMLVSTGNCCRSRVGAQAGSRHGSSRAEREYKC